MGKKHKKYSKELKTIFPPCSNIYIYRIVKPKSGKRGENMAVFIKKSKVAEQNRPDVPIVKKMVFPQDFLAINKIGCFALWLSDDNYS